jgi:hypothetical protein
MRAVSDTSVDTILRIILGSQLEETFEKFNPPAPLTSEFMLTVVPAPSNRPASRRAQARANHLRVWSSPRSAVRIEYPPDLLRKLALANSGHDSEEDRHGVLYGTRSAGIARVVSTCATADLEPIGVFAARARGEVFLTEEDLERLEALQNQAKQNSAAIALVIAGNTGGFFVREPDGSMQTIQSFQEFPIRLSAPKTAGSMKAWASLAIAAAALVMTALAWPSRPFTIQEHDGQMQIVLRGGLKPGARLEIVDGSARRSIPITPSLTSVVYTPTTHDVHISVAH